MSDLFKKLKKLQKRYQCYWSVEMNFGEDNNGPYEKISLYCGNWDYDRRYFSSPNDLESEVDRLLSETAEGLYKRIDEDLAKKENNLSKWLKDVRKKREKIKKDKEHRLKVNKEAK